LLFKDEFDLFDENKWTKGSNTWSGLTSTFTPDNTYVKDGQLVLRAKKTNAEEPQTGGDSDDDEGSGDDNNDSEGVSDNGSDGEGLKGGSEDDHDSEDDEFDSDEGKESDDDEGKESDDDEDSEEDSGDNSHEESSEEHTEPDFHVLPSPKSGTLDSAIEKTSRVLVSMVRTELQNFSQTMS